MRKFHGVVVAGLLCATSPVARADFLWTWHGDHNLFQGIFEVTDPEMLPNSQFTSSLFTNSISITSPEGIVYHATNSDDFVHGGFGPPLSLSLALFDDAIPARLSVVVVPQQASSITEFVSGSQGEIGEGGMWTFEYIAPEPGSPTLFAGGVVLCTCLKRRAGRSRPRGQS